ncbi:MAG TPA: cytochrome c oxidase assembly protein [Candidatus Binatia bacterium]|nr:cytochrome c oxidase assembly protein [Candidatus Binatia bacterium]
MATVRKLLLIAGALLVLVAPLALLKHEPRAAAPEAVLVLSRYLKASYARDYTQAYRFISAKDQELKPEAVYVRERGAFTGFTLVAARKLAEEISIEPAEITPAGDRTKIRVAVKLPDAQSLSTLLLDWDEEKLNALPAVEQRKILSAIDQLRRSGRMEMIEGEEEFVLIREDDAWRLALDWDAALRVSLAAAVPPSGLIEAEPVVKETMVKSSEPFRISYKVSNRSNRPLRTRIVHHVEPHELSDYLDIVECALLLPTLIEPGQQEEYSTTYLVRGDLPESAREFNITYEFKIDS